MSRTTSRRAAAVAVVAALAGTPLVADRYVVSVVELVMIFSIVAIGLNVLTGYAGQLSFGHAGLFATGAYASAALTSKLAVPFAAALPASVVITGAVGLLVGVPALRLRGLYLAMATLALSYLVEEVARSWESVTNGLYGMQVPPPALGRLTLESSYYYLILVAAVLVAWLCANLLRSSVGRAFRAVRDSETAAQAVGISLARYKSLAFGLSAMLTGLAGSLYAHLISFINPETFNVFLSIKFVAMIVVGGLASIAGSVLGAVFFTLVPELFAGMAELQALIFGVAMLVCILVLPEGLTSLGHRTRRVLSGEPASQGWSIPAVRAIAGEAHHGDVIPKTPLQLSNITVRFGGLVAVDDVSLDVNPGAIHAIIGPNGAGKSTLFNAITRACSAEHGRARWDGVDLLTLAPHQVVGHGVSRTFQNIELFPRMTVLENALLGRHRAIPARPVAAALSWPSRSVEEQRATDRVRALLAMFNLLDLQDRFVGELPFVQQRFVEIARALAAEPSLLLLDEPAAGLNRSESDHMAAIVRMMRARWGLTILLVEHDMRVVMGVSDAVTVLHHGRKIAEGRPAEIQRDQATIDAYLGRHHARA